jgi:hypothetical protein
VAGEPDLRPLPHARQGELSGRLARRTKQQLAGHRNATPDDDLVGVEGVDGVRDPDPEALAEDAKSAHRVRVAGLSRANDFVAVDVLPAGSHATKG